MDDRKNVKISGPAAAVLDRLVEDYAAKQAVVVERLLDWLGAQQEPVIDAIVRRKGEVVPMVVRAWLADFVQRENPSKLKTAATQLINHIDSQRPADAQAARVAARVAGATPEQIKLIEEILGREKGK